MKKQEAPGGLAAACWLPCLPSRPGWCWWLPGPGACCLPPLRPASAPLSRSTARADCPSVREGRKQFSRTVATERPRRAQTARSLRAGGSEASALYPAQITSSRGCACRRACWNMFACCCASPPGATTRPSLPTDMADDDMARKPGPEQLSTASAIDVGAAAAADMPPYTTDDPTPPHGPAEGVPVSVKPEPTESSESEGVPPTRASTPPKPGDRAAERAAGERASELIHSERLSAEQQATVKMYVKAHRDFTRVGNTEKFFSADDIVAVVDEKDTGWYRGFVINHVRHTPHWFPKNLVDEVQFVKNHSGPEEQQDVAQPVVWALQLSAGLEEDAATVTASMSHAEGLACVAVPRDTTGSFAVAVTVERLQPAAYDDAWISFGLSRVVPPREQQYLQTRYTTQGEQQYLQTRYPTFGGYKGSCGLRQHVGNNTREKGTVYLKDFGRRVDEFEKGTSTGIFTPPIRPGSRLALLLSARSAEGMRTARFFVDGVAAAVVVIDDDGGDSDWVAGLNLPSFAIVRIVPADGEEIKKGHFRPELEKQNMLLVASKSTDIKGPTEPTKQELKDATAGVGPDCSVLHRVLKETLTGIDEEFRLNFSAFLLYDEDGDGFISTSDMQTFATLRQGESLSYSQAESIVSEALHSRHGYAKDLRTIPYQVRDGPLRLCYEDFVAWQATG
jgi:hypothetical protein